jgi:ABC-type Fe3+/spermidine/putrescine transport system ATPase subunit
MEILKPKLHIEKLCKQYGEEVVLQNISFDVYENECLVILGQSGCGKTTLLKILIGLEKSDSGIIKKDNVDISSLKPHEREMGMVFQNYGLFPNMTALENVEYALKNKKPKHHVRKNSLEILDTLGMSDYLNKKPYELSGGQQQRVSIARTLILNPSIILMDEALSALDVENREIIQKILKDLKKTIIYITHSQEEAFFLADRIMVMSDGKLEQLDTPNNIYNNPTPYVEKFVVSHLNAKYKRLLDYINN